METQLPVSRAIQRALDIVDDHLVRTQPVYERRREHRRRRVHKHLVIYPCGPVSTAPIEGWSYEISRGGMGFVCESELPLDSIVIGFDLDEETPVWMRGSVKHCKEVIDEIFACGVQFTGRANPPA